MYHQADLQHAYRLRALASIAAVCTHGEEVQRSEAVVPLLLLLLAGA
jgi:hypothetical protein